MRVRVLAAWILVTLSAIAPIATDAGETWEARLRSEQVTVDDADVTTTNTKDLREHILRHVLDQDPRVMSGEWVDSLAPSKRMLDVDDDADGATPSHAGTNPKPTPASKCAPPNPKQLVKHGWRYNAWRYFPAPIDAATDPVYYSVGVGRDITFDAAIIAKHPRLEVHAFDNTPVASEFIKALGLKGGISPRWHWHELLLAGKDVREIEVALPRDRGDSFTPASADGVYFDGSKRKAGLDRVDGINEKADGAAKKLPARALWRVTETLGHAYVDVLKVDVEGAEFQVIESWEAYYGDEGPPVCQLLFEWHERFYPEWSGTEGSSGTGTGGKGAEGADTAVRKKFGKQLRREANAALGRMGFRTVQCDRAECVYWNCNHCPSLDGERPTSLISASNT